MAVLSWVGRNRGRAGRPPCTFRAESTAATRARHGDTHARAGPAAVAGPADEPSPRA